MPSLKVMRPSRVFDVFTWIETVKSVVFNQPNIAPIMLVRHEAQSKLYFARICESNPTQQKSTLADLVTILRVTPDGITNRVPEHWAKPLHVRYDGTLDIPPEAPPPVIVHRKRFYTKWWFWTAVAAGISGVVLPIVLTRGEDSCPSGYHCIGVNN